MLSLCYPRLFAKNDRVKEEEIELICPLSHPNEDLEAQKSLSDILPAQINHLEIDI